MSTQEAQEKYCYRFTLAARKPDSDSGGPSKSEIQAYINEILGAKPKVPGRGQLSR